jgi:hypothetical protein
MDLRCKHPFSKIVSGPSSAGKSVYVVRLLQSGLKNIDTEFDEILWCYSEWHPKLTGLKGNISFNKGLENIDRTDNSKPRLIVIDDLMNESDLSVSNLFTKGSHHTNTSVIFITQNIFHQGKGQRDMSLNSHYIVLFKNPRDSLQISFLARQINPQNPKFIQEAYLDATKRPHGYLLLDLKQNTPEDSRVRTNIFGEEKPGYPVVYKPNIIKVRHIKK